MGSAKRERQRQGRQARVAAAEAAHQRKQRFTSARNFGIIIAVIVVALFVLSRYNNGDDKQPAAVSTNSTSSTPAAGAFAYGPGPCPNADGSSPRTIDFTAAPQLCIDPTKTYTATFDTTAGKVVAKLDPTTTPGTVNNFVVLARYHYYDGTTIFRAAPSIGILQGGAAHTNSASDPGPGYQLNDEGFDYNSLQQGPTGVTGGPYKYVAGDLVMARASEANGASAQWFFGVNDSVSNLDQQGVYVKFGATTEGLDVLQQILASAPAAATGDSAPTPPVTVNSVTITES